MLVPSADRLSRVVKLALDSGEALNVAEAFALFASYRVRVRVGRAVARSATLQAALLTIVNTGRRCFLGGVAIDASDAVLSASLLVDLPRANTIGAALAMLGALAYSSKMSPAPEIWIGMSTAPRDPAIRLRCELRLKAGAVRLLLSTQPTAWRSPTNLSPLAS